MNLKTDEICYFQGAANAVNIKNAVIGSLKNSTYIGAKSSSGLRLGTGFSNTSNIRGNVVEKYLGNLFITNQRIILSTVKYGFEIPLTQITTMNFMEDGFSLMVKGKTYLVETSSVNKIKSLLKINNEYLTLKKKSQKVLKMMMQLDWMK